MERCFRGGNLLVLADSKGRLISSSADVEFAYASARVRMLEQRMLSRSDIERLLVAPSVRHALEILADTEYSTAVGVARDAGVGLDYERIFSAELERVYGLVFSFAPGEYLLGIWVARHAFHNLKSLLKASLQQVPVDPDTLFSSSPVPQAFLEATVASALEEPPKAGLPRAQRPPRQSPGKASTRDARLVLADYLEEAAETAIDAYSRYRAPEEIDQMVDAVYQRYLIELTDQPAASFLRGWVARFADVTNLRTFVRFAIARRPSESLSRSLLDGGMVSRELFLLAYTEGQDEEGRLDQLFRLLGNTPYARLAVEGWQAYQKDGLLYTLESTTDQSLLDYLREAKRQPFGVAPVWAYLMAKEQEIRLLRFILVGKGAGLSEAQLRERISNVQA